ncbi:CheR family methyltransferase [Conexibacter sp. JD483]|uniref:CheR family methyltransferase n=1 Tax=unclassified Conexibacter TaxID=2627773 RepID=UPI002717C0BF|nr:MULTISPECIES: CheR family methyltransferase [unclassified Conexibacter]MDO8188148.1 CheR family methyltransferase [Conexibacter sp. CPCC 205706]MDO8201288.1 CheR family methyltransferase [Conexibacter sp. CPCC 205762]MDR9370440.1 CheR family methyltransferase [Conexibacter sp. JD483]
MTAKPNTEREATDAEPLDLLLDHVKRSRGFDFTGYKRTSLERRIAMRMAAVECADYLAYLDFLEVHPEEFAFLFNTILINVTAFFRDAPAWEYLSEEVVPRLLEARDDGGPIRVWCAGCASGEEAYTIAIVLAEALGEAAFMERVKIYATDVDGEALATARLGIYGAKQVEGVSPTLLGRYFERVDQRFAFRRELRRAVIFGRNDLVQDAPISRIDLLVCRNTLMYFNAETQEKVLTRFNFALAPDGCLFLGKSEMLITHTDLFRPVSLRRRIFSKIPRATLRDRLLLTTDGNERDAAARAIRESGFDASPIAQIVIDANASVALVNRQARELFGIVGDDIGRPLKDLGLSYRPLDLRASVEQALSERRHMRFGPVEWTGPGGTATDLEVELTPLISGTNLLGMSIAYLDVTLRQRLRDELDRSRAALEAAYEELQSTVEELETTNEELQSTNEELETTNEELQSTNEELETTNEELQSTNEELETMNDELRQRTLELNEVNDFLEMILTSLGVALVVLNRQLQIQVWNAHSQELWGLRSEEVIGTHFLELDIGLPVEQLKASIRQALQGEPDRTELTLPATTRRGRTINCTVTVLPLAFAADEAASGAILLMERRTPADD